MQPKSETELQKLITEYEDAQKRSKFEDCSDVISDTKARQLQTRCLAAIERATGRKSTYYKQAVGITNGVGNMHSFLAEQIGVAQSLLHDIQYGYFQLKSKSDSNKAATPLKFIPLGNPIWAWIKNQHKIILWLLPFLIGIPYWLLMDKPIGIIPAKHELLERFFPQPTPKGQIGLWVAQLRNDSDDSQQLGIANALKQKINLESKLQGKVEVKRLGQRIEGQSDGIRHNLARKLGQEVNASLMIWGEVTRIADQQAVDVYLTFIIPVERIEPEQGPISIGIPSQVRLQVSKPEDIVGLWANFAKSIMAYVAHKEREYARSVMLFEDLIANCPDLKQQLTVFHFLAGVGDQALWQSTKEENYFRDAKKHFEYAAQHCNDPILCVNSRANLGALYWEKGDTAKAIQYHKDALKYDSPDKPFVLGNLGEFYRKIKEFSKAEEVYREALRLKPDSPRATLGLGIALMSQNKISEAEKVFNQAIKLDPKDHKAYFLLGSCLLKSGRVEEGRSFQKKAMEIAPDQVFQIDEKKKNAIPD